MAIVYIAASDVVVLAKTAPTTIKKILALIAFSLQDAFAFALFRKRALWHLLPAGRQKTLTPHTKPNAKRQEKITEEGRGGNELTKGFPLRSLSYLLFNFFRSARLNKQNPQAGSEHITRSREARGAKSVQTFCVECVSVAKRRKEDAHRPSCLR
jgi:hypothetical protein